MKIPKDIHGIHKIRDAKLLQLYLSGDYTYQQLAERFGISTTRINQIIYKNKALLKIDREYEKVRRVTHLKRILKTKGDSAPAKDAVDILDKIRTEIDDKNDSRQSTGDTKFIIIRESKNTPSIVEPIKNANESDRERVSGLVSIVRV